MLTLLSTGVPLHPLEARTRRPASAMTQAPPQHPQKAQRSSAAATVNPRYHCVTGTNAHLVTVELPGVEKESVNLHVEDYCLHLSAERVMPSADEAAAPGDAGKDGAARGAAADPAGAHRLRLTYAATFPLPKRADVGAVEADLKNGLLTIKVPHKRPETHRIQLQ